MGRAITHRAARLTSVFVYTSYLVGRVTVLFSICVSGVCPQQGVVRQLFCLLYLQHQAHPQVSDARVSVL